METLMESFEIPYLNESDGSLNKLIYKVNRKSSMAVRLFHGWGKRPLGLPGEDPFRGGPPACGGLSGMDGAALIILSATVHCRFMPGC
jgi:hypothetical protein